ncbi:hypothetical protein SEA_RICKMORE_81 [Gordonia phage Rickmore]|uniref:Uncharacterized protein n=1 Tax=Gordonia phage Rickmore TaxID=2507854 RepID=A0A410TBB9_9CAUD|nr:hypothetical protein HWC05_gp81 [Gordonia phage Rickmore]QAU06315.1 hypothetical protein SEA_RICKMORE_81 [Gordonia phage Rickmore]
MTFTTHGHHIPGTPVPLEGSDEYNNRIVSNCGRFNDCLQCASEAAEAMAIHAEILRQRALHLMGTPDISVNSVALKGKSIMVGTAICTCGHPHEMSTAVVSEGVSMDAARILTDILVEDLKKLHKVHVEIVSGVL